MNRMQASAARTYLAGYFQTLAFEALGAVVGRSFSCVSYCGHSVPTPGSPCNSWEEFVAAGAILAERGESLPVRRVIIHKSGDVTFQVSGDKARGYYRLWANKGEGVSE